MPAIPSKRAKRFAEERKAKKHLNGPKKNKNLNDFEAGWRSGYLQAHYDHAKIYFHNKSLNREKKKVPKENKPRYGNFDVNEAFRIALSRSYGNEAKK